MVVKPLGIDNVLIPVGDLDEAITFYRDLLGLSLRFRLDEPGLALLDVGTERPGFLLRRQDDRAVTNPDTAVVRMWLEVTDARAAATELREAGVVLVSEPFAVNTGWTVEVRDPWGTIIGLTDYVLAPERARSSR